MSIAPHDISEMAQTACENATSVRGVSFMKLTQSGWMLADEGAPDVRDLLADGILAAIGTTPDTPIDWPNAMTASRDLAKKLLNNANAEKVQTYICGSPVEAVLSAIDNSSDDGFHVIRGIYAGPFTDQTMSMLNTIRRMDEKAGISQMSPGLDLFTTQSQTTMDGEPSKTKTTDAQFGVFTADAASQIGRDPKVPAGFSLLTQTPR